MTTRHDGPADPPKAAALAQQQERSTGACGDVGPTSEEPAIRSPDELPTSPAASQSTAAHERPKSGLPPWTQTMKVRLWRFLFVLAVAVPVVATCWPTKSVYRVVARTGRVDLWTSRVTPAKWIVTGGIAEFSDGTRLPVPRGYVETGRGSHVRIERYGNREVVAVITRNSAGSDAASILGPDQLRVRTEPFVLTVRLDPRMAADSSGAVVLRISGVARTVRLDSERAAETAATLVRSGRVTLLAALWTRRLYPVTAVDLELGDGFVVSEADSSVTGSVLADEDPGLLVSYGVTGGGGHVARAGGDTYDISVTPLQLLQSHPVLQSVFLAVVFLLGVLSAIRPTSPPSTGDRPPGGVGAQT